MAVSARLIQAHRRDVERKRPRFRRSRGRPRGTRRHRTPRMARRRQHELRAARCRRARRGSGPRFGTSRTAPPPFLAGSMIRPARGRGPLRPRESLVCISAPSFSSGLRCGGRSRRLRFVFIWCSIGWCVAGVELAVMYPATRTTGVSGFRRRHDRCSLPAPLLQRGVVGVSSLADGSADIWAWLRRLSIVWDPRVSQELKELR
jgi:hypothetical protein